MAAVAVMAAVTTFAQPSAEDIAVVVRAQELLLSLKMKESHRLRLAEIIRKEWDSPTANLQQSIAGLHQQLPQLQALPERARSLAIRSNLVPYLEKLQEDAQKGDASSILFLEVYREAHKPVIPQAPLFSPYVADTYVDAYLFVGELMSGQPSPRVTATGRDKLRRDIAQDYAKMNRDQRKQMAEVLGRLTVFMIQWPTLDPLQRLMVRQQAGARLSPQEQAAVQQAQSMISQHNFAMMRNEIGFMKDMQNTIMGSAPYWNPSANRWEQKGGIVTEFH